MSNPFEGMKLDTFTVNYQLDPEFTGKDVARTEVIEYARSCIETWKEHVQLAGGKLPENNRPTAGIVEVNPDNPPAGATGLEPLRFLQVSGQAFFPPEDVTFSV